MNKIIKYIGGEIEINPFELDFEGIEQNKDNLNKYSFYSSGRGALKLIINKINPTKKILLPFYLCKSILQPFEEKGLKYDFYKINEDFFIDEYSILNKIAKKKYDVVLIINYFGFIGQNNLIIKKIKNFDKKISIIEDWSHLSFIPYELNYYKSEADFVFGSLRKIFPVPDGGFILNDKKYKYEYNLNIDDYLINTKILGKCIRYLYINNYLLKKECNERLYLKLLENGEKYLDKVIKLNRISKISLKLLSKLKFKEIYENRRRNYFHLLNLLKENQLSNYIEIIKENLEEGEMPYMFPVYIKNMDRNLLRDKLREKGIFCSIIWDIPEKIESFENRKISNKILCIPIDQRYSKIDMEIIHKKIIKTILS